MSSIRLLGAIVAACLLAGCTPNGKRPGRPPAPARHLVLVTIDTLRANRVGAYGYARARTPELDALAARGVRFDRAFATAPITLPSHASLLTGLYPPGHGSRHNGMRVGDGAPTLATVLGADGFTTGAFVAAFPLDRRFGLARGFGTYRDELPRDARGRLQNERPASAVVDDALAWVGRQPADTRVFLWTHFFEPHSPYDGPRGSGLGPGLSASDRYDEEIAIADRELGRLLDGLGSRRDDAVIVVTSDHGEAFGEHEEYGHSIFVYDTTLRVPLVFSAPGIAPRVVTGAVSLIDVAPTALALLGASRIDADGVSLERSLAGEDPPRRELYAESFAPLVDFGWHSLRALRSGPWKAIEAPERELYDLARDPGETKNLADAQVVIARGFEERVARYSGPELPKTPAPSAFDAEARTRLQALGYASGSARGHGRDRPDPKSRRALAARIAQVTAGELHGDALAAALEAIVADDPDNAQAHLRLGDARFRTGDCKAAEPHFTRAIALKLPSTDAYVGLAGCQARRGDVAGASETLRTAERTEPGDPVVLANLGILAAETGRLDEAVTALTKALTVDPDLHEARFTLARALARGSRRVEAAAHARELLERLPQSAPQRAEVERLMRALK